MVNVRGETFRRVNLSCSRTHDGGRFRTHDLLLRTPRIYHWPPSSPFAKYEIFIISHCQDIKTHKKFIIQSSEFRIRNSKFEIQNSELGIEKFDET